LHSLPLYAIAISIRKLKNYTLSSTIDNYLHGKENMV
jgi:hypothetical protein